MKKRILIILSIIAVAFSLTALCVACGKTATAEYRVTVLSPASEPLSGVTVSWMNGNKAAGSAKTGEDGKATANLAPATYTIALADYGEGLSYNSDDPAKVTSVMNSIVITLGTTRLDYSVTVKDRTGAPASGVNVTWMNGERIAGESKTGADGKATCSLYYGEYTIMLSNTPAGNVYEGSVTVNGKNPSAEISLREGVTYNYTVNVHSEGGLIFKDKQIIARRGTTTVATGRTDENGAYTFSAAAGSYRVIMTDVPEGYNQSSLTLTNTKPNGELVLTSEVITAAPSANTSYVIGDIIHDYEFETPYELNGKIWSSSVAEILKTKEILIINNWGTNCSWCVKEMPDMQAIYEKYSEQIEIVAVSNYTPRDNDQIIKNYYASNGYAFPMMMDANGLASKFNVSGWPTTIIIDRYGAIARIESGAIQGEETWERMIKKYIGPDYVQTFIPGEHVSESINNEISKPDVTIAPDHYDKIAETLNKTEDFPDGASVLWYGETNEDVNAWPFMYGTDEDVSPTDNVVYASNTGKPNSWAILYATVKVDAGKVFAFDYWADTESEDILHIIWDGRIIKELSGNSKGWQTCYLFSEITDGSHNLAFVYQKDGNGNKGKDNVYLRNVRFAEVSDITESTDMLRSAAYGAKKPGDTLFPYYAGVTVKEDGYYHVNLNSLQNSALAGIDESPLLLVNLLNATAWNSNSIAALIFAQNEATGNYVYDCTFTINGDARDYRADLIEYLTAATASDVPECVPVDAFLHDMLVQFMAKVSGSKSHDKEWLEACCFYSHYGDGDFVGNPILGLMTRTAIPVEAGKEYTADLTRNMFPFPTLKYTFTPSASAVYKIESLIPDNAGSRYAAQIWLYDDNSDPDHPIAESGDTHLTIGGVNEQNFELYRYMEAGHKYYIEVAFQRQELGTYDFMITNKGASAEVWQACSEDIYEAVLDANGKLTDIELSGAVEYVYDETDKFYRVINPDGTTGDYIYLDVLNADSSALGTIPLYKLIDYYLDDPKDYTKLDYTMFDFRYIIKYFNTTDESGNAIVTYAPKVDISSVDEKYDNYTEILRKYIEDAPKSGEYKGLIRVDKTLKEILNMFFELRLNGIYDNVIESALENEWLRFCWYKRVYNSANP